jgi:hypothetical protein
MKLADSADSLHQVLCQNMEFAYALVYYSFSISSIALFLGVVPIQDQKPQRKNKQK